MLGNLWERLKQSFIKPDAQGGGINWAGSLTTVGGAIGVGMLTGAFGPGGFNLGTMIAMLGGAIGGSFLGTYITNRMEDARAQSAAAAPAAPGNAPQAQPAPAKQPQTTMSGPSEVEDLAQMPVTPPTGLPPKTSEPDKGPTVS